MERRPAAERERGRSCGFPSENLRRQSPIYYITIRSRRGGAQEIQTQGKIGRTRFPDFTEELGAVRFAQTVVVAGGHRGHQTPRAAFSRMAFYLKNKRARVCAPCIFGFKRAEPDLNLSGDT